MSRNFGVNVFDARNAVQLLVRSPARTVHATESVLLDAYDISTGKEHDVPDSFILALARAHDADNLLTIDTDFKTPCMNEETAYRNPVPAEKLDELSTADG